MRTSDIHELPPDLPPPANDGAADHLPGRAIPSLWLAATDGAMHDLARVPGLAAVFAYPRTGRPDQEPLVPDWNLIPGARGCTVEACSFRDLAAGFSGFGCRIFGLSTQDTAYQNEMAERLTLPFPVLSDCELKLAAALSLPTMKVAGFTLLRRLTWIARDGVIEKVFYPVFPPDRNASQVLEWLGSTSTTGRA